MKSLAVYYELEDSNSPLTEKVELHVNVWKLPTNKKSSFEKFIDLGLKLEETKLIKFLYFFIPYQLTKKDVKDLGFIMGNSEKGILINTLFNANYSVSSQPNSDYYKITDVANSNELFHIYGIKRPNIKLEKLDYGTIVKVEINGQKEDKTYIRLRFDVDYTDKLSQVEKPSNSFFQSGFSMTETIDFRINEIREINNELLDKIYPIGNLFKFKKIHFFFMCCSREEYIFSHNPFISARQLEWKRWEEYVNKKNISNEDILAYHWKAKDENDYNALVQTKFEINHYITIGKYLLYLLIITIIFNFASNILYNKIFINESNHNTPANTLKKDSTNIN